MASFKIHLRTNKDTRKPEVVIEYESESDALAHEHEQEHRALAEKVLGVSLGDASIVVTRAKTKAPEPDVSQREQTAAREKPATAAGS